MSVNPNELIEQFAQEARDLLETIGERLMAIERAPQDQELLNDLFRQVHTFKGNCGLFEFQALERVVHAAEDVLDRVRSQKLNYSTELADAILDRLVHNAHTLNLTGESLRKHRPKLTSENDQE